MIIPETRTLFHKWYKEKHGKEINMTRLEIYSTLREEKDEELMSEAEDYLKDFNKATKRLSNSIINVEFPE